MKRFAFILAGALMVVPMVSMAQAGPISGASSQYQVVTPYHTDVYTLAFFAGETTGVQVKGDGSTNLDVMVFDENGNLISATHGYGDDCLVTWTPRWTGTFYVEVVNHGPVSNVYQITFA